MKKLLILVSMLMLSVSAYATQFKEGENYKVLKLAASATPTVSEYFSFYCPHCNAFEPLVRQLKQKLPDGVTFQKNHVSFMGGSMGPSMSKAYATMLALNVEDKMIPVMFAQVHKLRQPPKDDAAIRQIFVNHGIDGNKFDAAFNSFAVDSMVRRFDKSFEEHGLSGVPSVIVNNKYLVEAQSIKTADEYFKLINFLLKKK